MTNGEVHEPDGADDLTELKQSFALHKKYERCKESWEKQLLINSGKPELGSWLAGQWDQDTLQFTLICKTCVSKHGQTDCPWTTGKKSFQLGHATKHQSSWAHKMSVAEFTTEQEPEPASREQLRAALQKVWEDTQKGGNFKSISGDQTGSRSKCARMTDVLGKACKLQDQEIVRQAWTMAIHQDVRQGVLCVRFAASSLDCQKVGRGILGFCHHFGTKSEHIVEAVQEVVLDFCSCADGNIDTELYEHICASVELIDSDGASDEQKAIRLLADSLFPNCRFLCRDATHSARRLTKCPWDADAFLAELMEVYITGSTSITSSIVHSPDLRAEWCGFVAEDKDSEVNTVRFLGYSKDRFDSTTTSLSRFVLAFDSVWQVALHMQRARKGTEAAQRANDFFRHASVESLVQLAFMAEAAMESMHIVRYHDTESFDISRTPAVIAQYLHRLDTLFVRGEAPHVGHGRTMIKALEVERACILQPEQTMKSLGGPSAVRPEIIQRCLQRMAAYVKLVSARLELEFPSWRALSHFDIFDLNQVFEKRLDGTIAAAKKNIGKLAEIFQIDAEALQEQFLYLRANALHSLESGRCGESKAAWQLARNHLQDRRMRGKYDVTAIDQLLCRFLTFCGNTTSGVEQTFSSTSRCIGDYRKKMKPEVQSNLFRVLLSPISSEAINVAAKLYGAFKLEKQGCRWKRPRFLKEVPGQEATYLRKRKKEVDEARVFFVP